MFTLVLGTSNRKKRDELAELVAPLGIAIKTLGDFANAVEVIEDGATFYDNACKKGIEQARAIGAWVLAEDSGISVPALDDAPGVFSARFAGEPCDDEANNDKLLQLLQRDPPVQHAAFYTCCAVIVDPHGNLFATSEARCGGRITTARRGTNGFGYDPLFEIVEYQKTFGELAPEIKKIISHRARCLRQLLPALSRAAQLKLN